MYKNFKIKSWLLLAMMLVGASAAWADSYTITFGNNVKNATAISESTKASTVISDGTDYVAASPFTITGNCYYGDTQDCIRIGKSGTASTLTIALSDAGKVKATSIVVNCKNMGGNKNSSAKLNVNTLGEQATSSTEQQNLTFSYDVATDVENIVLAGTAAIYIYSITVNYEDASTAALSSIAISGDYPEEFYVGDEFSHEGMTVTATYEDNTTKDVTSKATFSGYDMSAEDVYEVTVSYTEGDVTATTTYEIVVEERPLHTATFYVNGSVLSSAKVNLGEAITFPTNAPAELYGKTFQGWATSVISGTQETAPEMVSSATMADADVDFYAVYANVTKGDEVTNTDELTNSTTGVSGTSYSDFSGKTGTSGAVYAGQCAGGNSSIQLRSNNSNSGVISTTSGGNLKKVVVEWNSNTADGRTLNVYGSNTAYGSAADLYGDNAGTLIGTIVNGTNTELSVDGSYTYVGMRSASGAMYIDKISITWASGTPDVATDYATNMVPTVTVTTAGYATYVAEDNVYFGDVTAYVVSNVSATSVQLEEVLAVEKGTPVVVKAAAGEYELEVVAADDCDEAGTNLLKVSDGTANNGVLVLANKSKGVGFYKWTGGLLPAGKVYLENTANAREYLSFGEEATAIDNAEWSAVNGERSMYNLNGQRVDNSYKGIVIANGKKYMNQ